MKMRNLSIGVRIGAGNVLMITVVAMMAGLGWVGAATLQDNLRTMYVNYTEAVIHLAKVRGNMGLYRNTVLQAVQAKNQREYEDAATKLPAIREGIDKPLASYGGAALRVSKSGRSETEDLKRFRTAMDAYYASASGVVSALADANAIPDPEMQERMRNLAATSEFAESAPKSRAASERFDELLKTVGEVAKDLHEEGEAAAGSAKRVLLGGLLISLLLAGGTAYAVTRSVVHPIRMVNAALQDIAEGEGDLTKRLKVDGQDEVGRLCEGFNRFVDKLHHSIERVATTTAGLAAAAEELSNNATQLSKGGQEQAQQAMQASAAVEEMSATVTEMAKNAQNVATTAQEASQAAGQGHEVVAGSIAGITRLAETVRASAERIHSLGQRSDQIGEIVRVIEDIADQTNLLALNAAIEAARAGEQGRGFAVVADEVRKLAERTTKATKEIGDTIRTIQADTTTAVNSMETGTHEAQEGMALANKAGERLTEIVGWVKTVTDMIQQMAAAIEEQSTASEQIAGNIEAVAAVSKRSEGGLTQVSQATAELARMAGDLQTVVGGFKLKG
ncbi:MAG TPA: methyl-accepting chemotaxis protein [Nitrospirales bacterium]|nr:methyl-accepting chemotaxis protein [Nitrospirales bacterium]